MDTLIKIQKSVERLLVIALWAHIPLLTIEGVYLDGHWELLTIGGIMTATAATAMWRLAPGTAASYRTIGVALMVIVAMIVGGLQGHPWQVDMHMYFFVALSSLTIFCDWKTLIFAAATVAIHHIVMNIVFPAAIYPGGADYFRVLLHATVLVLQTGILGWIAMRIQNSFSAFVEAQSRSDTIISQLRLANWAIEQNPNMIVITDTQMRITRVNAAFTKQTGITAIEAQGRNPAMIMRSGKTPQATYIALRENMNAGLVWQGRFINSRANGSEYISDAVICPILNDNGELVNYLSIQNDVTQQVHNAEALERAKQIAERASQAKGDFLSMMSHEIRTPLNAIIGFTRAVKRDLANSAQSDRLNKIEQSSNHLLRIINDVLDLSKIEAGKMVINPLNFSLKQLLGGVVSLISQKAEAQGLDVVVDVSALVPDLLFGDELRISQCLLNYASNALKVTRRGAIILRVSLERELPDAIIVRFTVEDTGSGISQEALPRLFNAFEQLDQSHTRQHGGTGLGLALTKQLAELMGGSVGVNSILGKGSKFWFSAILRPTLDIDAHHPHTDVQDIPEKTLAKHYSSVKILAVEDVSVNREILLDMLSEAGLSADTAENGEIAVRMAATTQYDLILMDIQMPVMDGMTATKAIRQLPNNNSVPIIALTANAFNADRQMAFDVGMSDFLAKPVLPELLFATMLKWLSANRQLQQQGSTPAEKTPVSGNTELAYEKIKTCLAGLSDIDLSLIPLAQKKPVRYISYFNGYLENYEGAVPRFRNFVATGDYDEARRLVHSLKGTSGQLGIFGIQNLAAEMETSVKAGAKSADLNLLADALQPRLSAVCSAIAALNR